MAETPVNFEISPNGKALIHLYKDSINVVDERERLEKLNLFCTELIRSIDPKHEPKFEVSNIENVLINSGGMVYFANGTSGDRIIFTNSDPLIDEVEQSVRWMVFPKEYCEQEYQKEIYQNWERIFGNQRVDLLQKVE
ncbi:MAG: hypothetical protein AAB778_02410 [Patescibacteria group bacterium]